MAPLSLALCLDAPMQSWGLRGRAVIRDTATEPTKSGVVGLLCCALGINRDDHARIAGIAALTMGIRVDREGILERDYHTTQNVPTTTGSGHRTVVSHRYYLADAVFLVVLHGDEQTLRLAHQALQQPHWPIYLGRRAYVPARPLVATSPAQPTPGGTGAGLVDDDLETVLHHHQWLEQRPETRLTERRKTQRAMLRTIVDCDPAAPDAETCYDHPLSFARDQHTFRARTIRRGHAPLTDAMIDAEAVPCT